MFFFLLAIRIVAKVIGRINPFKEPAKISRVAGLPIKIKISVEATINPIIKRFSFALTGAKSVFKKETLVYAAPTTDVIAAAKKTIPNILYPTVPAAILKASAAGFPLSNTFPANDNDKRKRSF